MAVGSLLASWCLGLIVLGWGQLFFPLASTDFGIRLAVGHGATFIVRRVDESSVAFHNGLRSGDEIDPSSTTYAERVRLLSGSPAGYAIAVRARHPGHSWRVVTVRAMQGPVFPLDAHGDIGTLLQDLAEPVTITIVCVVAGLLVLRRPSVMTAALALSAAGPAFALATIVQFSWLPDGLYAIVAFVILWLLSDLPIYALLVFVTRFPSPPSTASARLRMHVGDALFLVAAATFAVAARWEPLPYAAWPALYAIVEPIGFLVVLAFAVATLNDAHGQARQRIAWTIAGIVVNALTFELHNLLFGVVPSARTGGIGPLLINFSSLGAAMMFLALGYAVLRQRVLDVGFVIDRSLVYAVITSLAAIAISVMDWLSGKVLSGTRLVLVLEALVTVAFGLALNWIHARVDEIVGVVLFRRRRAMARKAENAIEAMRGASSAEQLDAMLSDIATTMDLLPAAVYRQRANETVFRRVAITGKGIIPHEISVDHPLARGIGKERAGVLVGDLAETDAEIGPFPSTAFAVSIASQRDFFGFAVYGAHSNGRILDPDEAGFLRQMAAAAAEVFQFLETQRWRERAMALERLVASAGK
ncbi:MAG: hypothetical protein JO043_00230 [Candidatus Eremiobacteraeota bacterium]|nr:hypothetical protein [Candidatus Eremiobacteraeota bacterium]